MQNGEPYPCVCLINHVHLNLTTARVPMRVCAWAHACACGYSCVCVRVLMRVCLIKRMHLKRLNLTTARVRMRVRAWAHACACVRVLMRVSACVRACARPLQNGLTLEIPSRGAISI